jgi:hypothetical protein
MYTTGKSLNFYWRLKLKVLPAAEVYSLWYRSTDLSTDPGLKSHLITFPWLDWTLNLLEYLHN